MRIAHISDLHIRNFKYRDEYRAAFDDLHRQLADLGPSLVINTGDTVHSKLAVSPELFDDVSNHIKQVLTVADYWIILGNHDLNLKNKSRMDAISPIVRALRGFDSAYKVKLLGPGEHTHPPHYHRYRFWNYDIRGHEPFEPNPYYVNIGLYHGSVAGCVTDLGFVMEDAETDLGKFQGMDYVLMGDIHKRQSFRDGRVRYPGSLIQQNYGEEREKGFLLWDIQGKDEFSVEFHPVAAPGRFYSIQVPATLDLTDVEVPPRSRIKATVLGELSPSRRFDLDAALRQRFDPLEVIIPESADNRPQVAAMELDQLVGERRKLIEDYLRERGLDAEAVRRIHRLFTEYESQLDDDAVHDLRWSLRSLRWDNMLNYGEGNVLDLSKIPGLVGIFAPNSSGKSTIFDVMLQALFDKTSKEVPRNIDLINDNKDVGTMRVEFEGSGQGYLIERRIERIHYGQRKFTETKQWGRTELEFSTSDGDPMNGTTRPETERMIRGIIGSFEDFALSTMVTQGPIFGLPGGGDIINCKETDRRKILFRFLKLDVFERIAALVKDDLKVIMGQMKDADPDRLTQGLLADEEERSRLERAVTDARTQVDLLEPRARELLEALTARDIKNLIAAQKELESIRKTLPTTELHLSTLEAELEFREKKVSSLKSEMMAVSANIPSTPPVSLADLANQINDVRQKRESSLVDKSQFHTRLNVGAKSLKNLDDIPCGSQFPTCRFIRDAVEFVNARDEIREALDRTIGDITISELQLEPLERMHVVHTRIQEAERHLATLRLELEKMESLRERARENITKCREKLEATGIRISELQGIIADASYATVSALTEERNKVSCEINDAKSLIDKNLRTIGSLDDRIDRQRNELAQLTGLKERARDHEILADMCGKNGVPYRIVSLVLPLINAEIEKILAGLVKFSVFFEDDPENQTVSLYIRYGDYRSRPLSLGGGAERFIASLAIRVALLSVSSLPKTDMLIIDEGFGKLDPENLEALQRMFEYLKGSFRHVFVVSHVDFMRDIVDHSIEITSSDGYAHVEVI